MVIQTTKMKMKTNQIIYSIILIGLCAAGCGKLDNYEAPNISLTGKVIDSITNQSVENSAVLGGTLLQLYEENTTVQPTVTNSFPDGSFRNLKLFPAQYRVVALGAFRTSSNILILDLTKDTYAEIKVLPNLRLKATLLTSSGTTADVKVEYEKVHPDEKLNTLGVVWSTINNPNFSSTYQGGSKILNVASQNLTSGEMTFTITGLNVGTKYYVRAVGLSSNARKAYNYSTTIQTP